MIRKIKEQKDKESLLALLNSFCSRQGDSPEQSSERGRAFLEECGGTVEGVVKMAEETRPYYRLAAKMLELPLDQFEKEFELEARKQAGNPVFKTFFPAVPICDGAWRGPTSAAPSWRRPSTSSSMAADALKNHPDPVVGGPFEFVPFEGGFESRSKFKQANDKPWVLVVGQRGK